MSPTHSHTAWCVSIELCSTTDVRYVLSTTTSASGERALEVAALVARRLDRQLAPCDRLLRVEHDLELLPFDVDQRAAPPAPAPKVSATTAATGAPA